jgi:hypothetical protein
MKCEKSPGIFERALIILIYFLKADFEIRNILENETSGGIGRQTKYLCFT